MFVFESQKFSTQRPQYVVVAGGHTLLRLVLFDNFFGLWTATAADHGGPRPYPLQGYLICAMVQALAEMDINLHGILVDTDSWQRAYGYVELRWDSHSCAKSRGDELSNFICDLTMRIVFFLGLRDWDQREMLIEGDQPRCTLRDLKTQLDQNGELHLLENVWIEKGGKISFQEDLEIVA